MKIACIAGFAWQPKGTVRSRAYPLAAEMVRRGHQVTLVLAPYDNPGESGRDFLLGGVRILNIDLPGGKLRRFASIPRRLIAAAESVAPDLIHVFKPKGFAGMAATLLRLGRGRPWLLDCDDWEGWGGWNEVKDYPWLVKEFIDVQERGLIGGAPIVTAASRTLQYRALSLRDRRNHVFYLPNGISPEQMNLLHRLQQPGTQDTKRALGLGEDPLIVYAGNFDPADQVLFFCRATAPIAVRHRATLAVVGDGPELQSVRSFFSSSSAPAVRYFGRLPYEKYATVIAAADVVTFPYPDSPVFRAKCSARIIDYMALGKAVLTTGIGQNLEYIVDGESGVLTAPGDRLAYETALDRLLRDHDFRRRLGKHAQECVRRKFLWNGELGDICEQAYKAANQPHAPEFISGNARTPRRYEPDPISRPASR